MSEATLLEFIHAVNFSRYCQVAVCAAVLYEHLTTLDSEVELIWKTKWSMIKFLFLMTRYIGNLISIVYVVVYIEPLPSTSRWIKLMRSRRCAALNAFQGFGAIAVIMSMQGIMQYRVSAMYRHSKVLIVFMSACFFGECLSSTVLFGVVWNKTTFSTEAIPGFHVCTAASTPDYFYAVWIPPLFFDGIICLLALHAGIRWHTAAKTKLIRVSRPHNSGLWFLLLRDSITFPFLTLAAYTINLVVYRTLPPYWVGSSNAFVFVTCRILGCRLVLNLREAYYLPFDVELDDTQTLPSSIEFEGRTDRGRSVSTAYDIELDSD